MTDRENLREGVRRGILDALALDLDRTSARTAGRLAAAGALGMAGAVGSVALFSGDLLRDGHGWYLAVCAAAWAGLLVACFAVALLRIRTEWIPLTQACVLALLGLGLAAILALLCPDRHHLAWWTSTPLGRVAVGRGGLGPGAFCLGACSALLVGAGATVILALRHVSFRGAMLPGILLFLCSGRRWCCRARGRPVSSSPGGPPDPSSAPTREWRSASGQPGLTAGSASCLALRGCR